mgnify:CR=1 FL=1
MISLGEQNTPKKGKMEQNTDHPEPSASNRNWKTPATLIGVLVLCLGLLWIGNFKGCGADKPKDHPPVKSTYYYQLIFHMKKMGPAVFQATGDQGKKTSEPMLNWLMQAELLTRYLSNDKVASKQCRTDAANTYMSLHQLDDKLEGSQAYDSGYKAWDQINQLLIKCR